MDLMSAKKEIVERSRKEKGKKFYLNVDDEGEVEVSEKFIVGRSGFCYRNGSEIALPEENKTPEPKGNKNKQTPEDENSKAMEKVSGKKVAKKSAKKLAKTAAVELGKKVKISIADMRKNLKKGYVYRNLPGNLLSEEVLAGKARQEHVREVYELKGK